MMKAKEKTVEGACMAKQSLKKTAFEGRKAIEKLAIEDKNQAIEVINYMHVTVELKSKQLSG